MSIIHRWEALLPEDFPAEFDRAPIAYKACGAMEEHGLQCALGTDPYTAYEVCLRTADIVGASFCRRCRSRQSRGNPLAGPMKVSDEWWMPAT